eukprot:5789750-Prorocentrum_lima.AAC.1
MTSSLVGSEMCIRDSLQRSLARQRKAFQWEAELRERERMLEAADHPVSYTHLTLPTICSV